METRFLKPADGLKVRDEAGKHIPEDGAELPLTTYIRRRIRCGDLVEATAAVPPRAAKTTKTSTEA